MPRRKRPLNRDTGVVKDARLAVIASEDLHAVEQYFAKFQTRRIKFLVLATEDGRSSPDAVMDRLDRYKTEWDVGDGDQLWVCLDTDHWIEPNHIQNLRIVVQQCKQKGYRLAISNPCFELWLLLHFQDFSATTAATCEQVESQLRQAAGGYDKSRVDRLSILADQVQQAIARARSIDPPGEIPTAPTTRVYLLIEELLQRETLVLG